MTAISNNPEWGEVLGFLHIHYFTGMSGSNRYAICNVDVHEYHLEIHKPNTHPKIPSQLLRTKCPHCIKTIEEKQNDN